jgi:hypothetical protein
MLPASIPQRGRRLPRADTQMQHFTCERGIVGVACLAKGLVERLEVRASLWHVGLAENDGACRSAGKMKEIMWELDINKRGRCKGVQERESRGGREKKMLEENRRNDYACHLMTYLSLEMTGASCTAMLPILSFMPTHVGMPLTSIESLTRMGTPERYPSEPWIPRFRFRG